MEKVSKSRRLEWKEEKRSFMLDYQSNKASIFLLCEVRDGEGKKHNLFFPKGNGFTKGWDLLENKSEELGIKGKQEKKSTLPSANTRTRSFADTVKLQRSLENTI